jgi:hypothetical protein
MALLSMPHFEGGMDRLIKDEIIEKLDLSDLEQCIDCIRGKYAKTIKKVQLGVWAY